MKRFMTMMLALSFLAATVNVAVAQETKSSKKKTTKHKGGKKKTSTPKKDGGK